MDQIIILHAHRWELLVLLHSAWHFHDHSSLLHLTVCLLFSFLPHPTQETCLPAGRGSAQRRLQPVRKNSHLAPHASLHHPTLLSPTSPALPPWHPSLLFSSATLLFLPFDSDHWVSLRLLCLRPHFARQMDRRREDGLTSRYARVCLWDGRRKRKGGEVPKLFLEVKMSNSNEVRRLLSVKPVWGLAFQATEWQGCS